MGSPDRVKSCSKFDIEKNDFVASAKTENQNANIGIKIDWLDLTHLPTSDRTNSVTRFGEISPLLQKLKCLGQH